MENTRRSRRNQTETGKDSGAKDKLRGVTDKAKANPKAAGLTALGVVMVAVVGTTLAVGGTHGMNDTVNVSKWAHFDKVESIEGFTAPIPRTDTGSSALVSKQSTNSISKNDNTCSFNGQISYLPSYNAGRGDDYLTKNYLYNISEGNGVTVGEFDSVKVASDQGKIEAFSTAYEYQQEQTDPATGKTSTAFKYRSVAVRVIDTPTDIEGLETAAEGQFGSDPKKGLPVITLSYDCDNEESFDKKEWKKLVSSVSLDLNAKDEPDYDARDAGSDASAGYEERGVEPETSSTTGIEPDQSDGDNPDENLTPEDNVIMDIPGAGSEPTASESAEPKDSETETADESSSDNE